MAIGTPIHRGNGGGSTSAVTGSFTPTAGATLLAFVTGLRSTTLPANPTVSDSAGLTWVERGAVDYNPGANRRMKSRLFVATVGGSPSSMTVTGACSDGTETTVTVTEVTGVGSDFSNVITGTNSAGDPSGTLAAFSTGGVGIGFAAMQGSGGSTPPSGYTELYDATISANGQSRRNTTVYDLTSPGTALSFSSSNTYSTMIGLELKEPYYANAVEFDGVNDYLSRSGLVSSATSSTGSLSIWLYLDADSEASGYYPVISGTSAFDVVQAYFYEDTTWTLEIDIYGVDGVILAFQDGFTLSTGWVNVLFSWDTNHDAGDKIINYYINDSAAPSPYIQDLSPAFTVDYAEISTWAVATDAGSEGSSLYNGSMAEIWLDPSYIDFSVEANRRKFIDASGKPVSLGADGSLPTGSAPAVYLKDPAATFGNNSGAGGNFTINGAFVDTESPSGPAATIFDQLITVGVSAAVSLSRRTSKAVSAAASSAVSLVRATGKRIAAPASSVVLVGKGVARSLGVAASATVAVVKSAVIGMAAAVASSVSATALKVKTVVISAAVSASVSMSRAVGKGVAVPAGVAVAVAKAVAFRLAVAASASVAVFRAFPVLISASVSVTVGMTRAIGKVIAASVASAVAIALSVVANWIPLKVYRGGAWVLGKLRIRRDGEWVRPNMKRRVGDAWLDM